MMEKSGSIQFRSAEIEPDFHGKMKVGSIPVLRNARENQGEICAEVKPHFQSWLHPNMKEFLDMTIFPSESWLHPNR